MPVITGTVRALKVGFDYADATVLDEDDGIEEHVTVFSRSNDATAYERVIDSMLVSLLKDALVHNRRVEVRVGSTSGNVQYVNLLSS